MITVYKYDENGLYTGAEHCYPSPLEPGQYITPTNSTTVPPDIQPNSIPKLINAVWINIPDYIGQTWYDQSTAEPVEIKTLGMPAANLAPTIPIVNALDKAKLDQCQLISTAAQSSIISGISSTALGSPFIYPSGQIDQLNLMASVVDSLYPGLPVDWNTPFKCTSSTGVKDFVSHSATQIQQVGSDVKQHIQESLQKSATLQAQINAETTIQAVQSVIW